MIKKSLQWKLIASYLAVALLTILMVTVVIRLTSGQQFYNLVMEQQASLLRDDAVYYYSQTGSWDGFFESYAAPAPSGGQPQPGGQPSSSEPIPREIRGKHGLVDTGYRAIMPFMNYQIGQVVPAQYLKNLIPVEVNGETVAWIIPDTRFQFQLSTEETMFLQRTNQAILLAALAGIASAVLMGIVLARVLLKPVRNLIGASRKLAAGDLEQQVPVKSQDELGQLSQTFNQMSADLARADRQRRQLTADVTHDLGTPLQVIAGYMEMFQEEDVPLTPERIGIIMSEIDLLRRLVGDLSLLSLADAKELQIQLEPIDSQELLKQIHGTYEAIARKENKEIEYQVAPDTPPFYADAGRMAQVIRNLVDNAIRYTPAGGTIRLSAAPVEGQVEIRVQDSGSGIPPDDLPYVFDRFYKVDKSRGGSSGKMGLGLAIARALVVAQGGSILVESSGEGAGTTFVIRLRPI